MPAETPHARQRLVRERRQYNQWVASQTLEDFALRYTAARARRSSFRVGNTALGPIAFLACEAIGATITLAYGFDHAVWAIGSFTALMFLIGLPIAYYAARYGVDIDLLTRGAGFGYMGSTVTSLIYASFTFLLFSIEATIMSVALEMLFGVPLSIAYVVSSLVVIPIALYGITFISRMQLATQGAWLLLQFLPLVFVATRGRQALTLWTHFTGASSGPGFLAFGMAASMLLSLLPQIGEQVDYLRFLPLRRSENAAGWWSALLLSGPGWVLIGAFKLLAGSFLAVLALHHGVPWAQAAQPSQMYFVAYRETLGSPRLALVLTGVFVVVCQLKINVTNAYAGSIAWSNFFSRLTHSHPGRVVWLVFNVVLALLLMEIGIFRVIDGALMIYANFAAGWIGALTADLVINKPLGLSPPYIEFKRAHLYDINPVGVGALALSVLASSLSFLGLFGPGAQALSPFIGLTVAFATAPLIAWATAGRYYLARAPAGVADGETPLRCTVCENEFEGRDMALCPAYSGPICSLCCTLEARCRDLCKTNSRFTEQLALLVRRALPQRLAASVSTRAGQFTGLLLLVNGAIALLLAFIYHQYSGTPGERAAIGSTLWVVFLSLLVLSGVAAWLIVLAHESRRAAEQESARQTGMLMEEIEAHRRTDAALQRAKEVAEAANIAKTRYIVGVSHEIRTPLNSILGYAQLLERSSGVAPENVARIIRRSSEHLSNLVDGLLDISRIENGLVRLSRDKVRLREFLEQIVDMFRLQAAAKGIAFRYRAPSNLPAVVHTDQKRLRQILINLLSNAIKYTEQGHAALTVRYRSEVAEFEVGDTGFGIAAEDLERVFEPFERGHGAEVRSQPGTGLGLTITRLLTQIMGGEILVRSTPGEGTTFVVRLQLSQANHGLEEIRAPQQPVRGYAGPRRRILLVDDDAAHLELLTRLLEPLGFEIATARDGGTCLELAAAQAPDLVLLDISMPDLTGWEVAKRLRAADSLQRLKILVVSANAHEYTPGGDGGHLHDGFLVKPIDIGLLLDSVGALLGLEWLRDAPTPEPELMPIECHAPAGCEGHLQDLYELGRIGHVRGIEAKLKQLEAESPTNGPLAAHLRGLIARFDLKRYMTVLTELRGRG